MRHRATLDVEGDAFHIACRVAGEGSPLLLVHGLRAARLTCARCEVLECGHSPMLEAAARFTDLLRDFLAGAPPRPAVA